MWTGNKTSPTRKNTPPSNYTRKKWNVSEGACFGLPIYGNGYFVRVGRENRKEKNIHARVAIFQYYFLRY